MAKLTAFLVLCGLTILTSQCEAYQMSRCTLVHQLRRHGFPEHQLRDWVCLVESESSRRTHVVGGPNQSDGSYDYGLFQISDRYWCNHGWPGKGCNVACHELTKANIGKAARCAKHIYSIHNFSAWYGWKAKCLGQHLPDISHC